MKIAIVTGIFPKINETFVVNEIIGLMEAGHEVDIIALSRPEKGVKIQNNVIRYNLLKKVKYISLSESRLWRFWGLLMLILENIGPNLKIIFKWLYSKKYTLYERMNNLLRLRPFLRKKYDIVHCHFGSNAIQIQFLKEFVDTKFIVTFQGYDISKFVKDRGKDVYQKLFDNADLLLSVCDYFRKRLVSMGCDASKTRVHYSAIDTAKFPYIERPFDFTKTIRILSVGRLVAKKGFEYSLKAVAEAIKKYPHIQYTIVGSGEEENNLKSLAKSLGIVSHVSFLGDMIQEEFMNYLYQSDIFILACLTSDKGDEEGISNVLKEAMATGMPAISAFHSGIPELIKDGESGLLVPQRDVTGLAQKLIFLVEHPNVCRTIGVAGRKRIEESFELKKITKDLCDIYRGLLNGYVREGGNAQSEHQHSSTSARDISAKEAIL